MKQTSIEIIEQGGALIKKQDVWYKKMELDRWEAKRMHMIIDISDPDLLPLELDQDYVDTIKNHYRASRWKNQD